MKMTPFWTDQTPRPEEILTSDFPEEAEVAIIGSGYTGLNAAIVLSEAGAEVAVLEQETIGWGGSSRNGGLVAADLGGGMQAVEKHYGIQMAQKLWRWSVESCDLVEQIILNKGIECDYQRNGEVRLAWKPKHFEKYRRYSEYIYAQFGYDGYHIVERTDLQAEIGSPAYQGGLVDEHAAGLDPAKFVFGLARAAAENGVKLLENAKVTKIRRLNGRFYLETSRGGLLAKEVLLATNGYTTFLVPAARFGINPAGSSIIITVPLPKELQAELSPKGRIFVDSNNFLNYFQLTADGRMMFGGRRNLSANIDPAQSARELRKRMTQVFPQLKNVPITHVWTGKICLSFDRLPHIGRIDGIHYAYGYTGHGVASACHLGYEAGQLIAGQIESCPLMEIKHPRTVFAAFSEVYLPMVSLWYRVVDWVS